MADSGDTGQCGLAAGGSRADRGDQGIYKSYILQVKDMKKQSEITKRMDAQKQRNEWRKKGWSIPELRGGKQIWYDLIIKLVELIDAGNANDINSVPDIEGIANIQTWRVYSRFLKGVGLVYNHAGSLRLSIDGEMFLKQPTKKQIANLIQDRFRLFGETLDVIAQEPETVEEVHRKICKKFGLTWVNLSNTRSRMDWLEILGLIQGIGNRKWEVTELGKDMLQDWHIIDPEVLEYSDSDMNAVEINEPPVEIAMLLEKLKNSQEMHKKRCTYNIWVPSPNRIENLRRIVQIAIERISRKDLFEFIEKEFGLKVSSAESMLPFLKASGLLEEVGRNVYMATAAAQAWIETGNDLDLIRILHAHMRFVGEIILYAENDIIRNDLYSIGKRYSLNNEKVRWLVGFLLEAGLLEEPQYLHLRATRLGKAFADTLPMEKIEETEEEVAINDLQEYTQKIAREKETALDKLRERLSLAAVTPGMDGKMPGWAFEEAICDVFSYMGFQAEHIGGAGDTDIVLKWRDKDDTVVAIIDGKSRTNGQVSHGDISDIALDTHKEKHNADYVAIIGAGFSGDTIHNFAIKKEYALITDKQLIEIAYASKGLGLKLSEIALMFKVPDGFSQLEELILTKRRELEIVSEIIRQFCIEKESVDSLSPRDLFFLLKNSSLSPTVEELISGFNTLSNDQIGVLRRLKRNTNLENVQYVLCDENKVVNRLRALADAIEKGLN